MIRRSRAMLLAIVMLVGASVVGWGGAIAQEATPAPATGLPEGVTPEFIAYGPAQVLPQAPADIAVFRLTLDPGSSLPSVEVDPIGSFIIVETGKVAITVENVDLTVGRLPATGFPSADDFETVPAGTEVTLMQGDSLYVPPLVAGELRNDGQEPAVLLVVNISPIPGGTGAPEASPAA